MVGIALDAALTIAVQAQHWTMRSRSRSAGFGLGEDVERAKPRRLLPLVEIEVGAELAGDGDRAVLERQLPRNEKLAVEVEIGHVIGDGRATSGSTRSSAFSRASISPAMPPPIALEPALLEA